MWLKAKTPIKIAPGVTVGAGDPPFEADDATASELRKLDAVDDGTAEREQIVQADAAAAAAAQAKADAEAAAAAQAQADADAAAAVQTATKKK